MANITVQDGLPFDLEADIRRIRGVGGVEPVLEGQVSAIILDDMVATPFSIQMGALQYGFDFELDGILGFDFLRQVKAQLDFDTMEIQKK